jgi:hypothetical protein
MTTSTREDMLERLNAKGLKQSHGAFTKIGRFDAAMHSEPLVDHPMYRAYWIHNHGGTILVATHGPHNAKGHKAMLCGVGELSKDCFWVTQQHSAQYTNP